MPFRFFKTLLGASLYCMSLSGLLAQEIVTSPAFSGEEVTAGPGPGPSAISPDQVLQADLDNGSTIFDNACAACHGETGQGRQDEGPALTKPLSLSEIMLVIHDGSKTMPSFDVFTDQELVDISVFVSENLNQ